ncbi:MAG TPA: hypothetical protein PLN55_12350 [Burkholderiaceae bacterium]|nr:hypothetical protein [Burkholderiaceae bacterium]
MSSFLTSTTALALALSAGMALAQGRAVAPPPPTEAPAAAPGAPAPSGSRRVAAELPAADKAAAENPPAAAASDPGLVPTEQDLAEARARPPAERVTRIEQVRQGNQVTEVVVTPANTERSFVMQNRPDRPDTTPGNTGGTLTVPMFFNWDF